MYLAIPSTCVGTAGKTIVAFFTGLFAPVAQVSANKLSSVFYCYCQSPSPELLASSAPQLQGPHLSRHTGEEHYLSAGACCHGCWGSPSCNALHPCRCGTQPHHGHQHYHHGLGQLPCACRLRPSGRPRPRPAWKRP